MSKLPNGTTLHANGDMEYNGVSALRHGRLTTDTHQPHTEPGHPLISGHAVYSELVWIRAFGSWRAGVVAKVNRTRVVVIFARNQHGMLDITSAPAVRLRHRDAR